MICFGGRTFDHLNGSERSNMGAGGRIDASFILSR